MTDLIRAVDLSYAANLAFEDPDRFRAWCAARLANGEAEMLIVNCWLGNATPLGAEEALRIAREVGLLTAAYCAVHDGRPGGEHVAKAIEGAGGEWPTLEFCAIDCEEIAGISLHPETIGDALYAVDATGQPGIIYTRGSYWRKVQGNTQEFAAYPLWEAWYGVSPNLEDTGGFGGWPLDSAKGLQYHGTTDLDGVAVDFSVFDRAWLESLTVKEERMQNLTGVVERITEALTDLWHIADAIAGEGATERAVEMQKAIVEIKRAIGIQEEQ